MPIGDPQGGLFEYTVEGLPESILVCVIPVSDPERSKAFYSEVLGMRELGSDGGSVYMVRGDCRIILRRSNDFGVEVGAIFGVDSPYNTRRRLMDEDVEFKVPPVRGPFGTFTSFLDPDGNVLTVMECGAEFRLR